MSLSSRRVTFIENIPALYEKGQGLEGKDLATYCLRYTRETCACGVVYFIPH